jgi:hypothetical protein
MKVILFQSNVAKEIVPMHSLLIKLRGWDLSFQVKVVCIFILQTMSHLRDSAYYT